MKVRGQPQVLAILFHLIWTRVSRCQASWHTSFWRLSCLCFPFHHRSTTSIGVHNHDKLYVWSQDPNSCFHTWMASTLPTEQTSRFEVRVCLKNLSSVCDFWKLAIWKKWQLTRDAQTFLVSHVLGTTIVLSLGTKKHTKVPKKIYLRIFRNNQKNPH